MMLPTDDEIRWNPGRALRAIRNVRCEVEVSESAAIRAAVAAGWSLRSVSIELGVRRNAALAPGTSGGGRNLAIFEESPSPLDRNPHLPQRFPARLAKRGG